MRKWEEIYIRIFWNPTLIKGTGGNSQGWFLMPHSKVYQCKTWFYLQKETIILKFQVILGPLNSNMTCIWAYKWQSNVVRKSLVSASWGRHGLAKRSWELVPELDTYQGISKYFIWGPQESCFIQEGALMKKRTFLAFELLCVDGLLTHHRPSQHKTKANYWQTLLFF